MLSHRDCFASFQRVPSQPACFPSGDFGGHPAVPRQEAPTLTSHALLVLRFAGRRRGSGNVSDLAFWEDPIRRTQNTVTFMKMHKAIFFLYIKRSTVLSIQHCNIYCDEQKFGNLLHWPQKLRLFVTGARWVLCSRFKQNTQRFKLGSDVRRRLFKVIAAHFFNCCVHDTSK